MLLQARVAKKSKRSCINCSTQYQKPDLKIQTSAETKKNEQRINYVIPDNDSWEEVDTNKPKKILEMIKVRRKGQQNQLEKRELSEYTWQQILDFTHSQIKACISSTHWRRFHNIPTNPTP